MLRQRSSIWILALIVGSVCTQDVEIPQNQPSEIKEIKGKFGQTDSVNDVQSSTSSTIMTVENSGNFEEIQLEQTTPLTVKESKIEISTTSIPDDEVKTTTAITTKVFETKTERDTELKPDNSNPRKGTIQFVMNGPSTRYPPHYYTPYTYPTPRPTPSYYPYPPYPPYPYPPYPTQAPTTSRPWPPYGGYPNYPNYPNYPGYFPGYGYRPPFGYPGNLYGGFGNPWYQLFQLLSNNTFGMQRGATNGNVISTLDHDIGKPIRNLQTPIKSMPLLTFLNFNRRKK